MALRRAATPASVRRRTPAPAAPPGAAGLSLVRFNPKGEQILPPRFFFHRTKSLFLAGITALLLAFFAHPHAFAAPPGTVISNQARLDYLNTANVASTEFSNVVDVVTVVTRSAASIELTRVSGLGMGDYQETVGPAACFQGGSFVTLANPVILGGQLIDPAQVREVSATGAFNLGEPVVIRLTDTDQNVDDVDQCLDASILWSVIAVGGFRVVRRGQKRE